MTTKGKARQPDPQKMSFEQATEELEAIIEQIESGELGLQDSLAQRKRGDGLLKRCRAVLDEAEQELEKLSLPSSKSSKG